MSDPETRIVSIHNKSVPAGDFRSLRNLAVVFSILELSYSGNSFFFIKHGQRVQSK